MHSVCLYFVKIRQSESDSFCNFLMGFIKSHCVLTEEDTSLLSTVSACQKGDSQVTIRKSNTHRFGNCLREEKNEQKKFHNTRETIYL